MRKFLLAGSSPLQWIIIWLNPLLAILLILILCDLGGFLKEIRGVQPFVEFGRFTILICMKNIFGSCVNIIIIIIASVNRINVRMIIFLPEFLDVRFCSR